MQPVLPTSHHPSTLVAPRPTLGLAQPTLSPVLLKKNMTVLTTTRFVLLEEGSKIHKTACTAIIVTARMENHHLSLESKCEEWRCILRSTCKVSLHFLDGKLVGASCDHNHDPELADCEVRATLSKIKDAAITTR